MNRNINEKKKLEPGESDSNAAEPELKKLKPSNRKRKLDPGGSEPEKDASAEIKCDICGKKFR